MTAADLGVGVTDDGSMGPRSNQPKRRTFSAEYKLAMVAEYDAAIEPGAKGALLRREGLYSSHIIEWRRARDAGALSGLEPAPRKPARSDADREAERLRVENERLRAELAKTKAALDVVGKAHALLGLISESADTDPRSTR
jgi:transposase